MSTVAKSRVLRLSVCKYISVANSRQNFPASPADAEGKMTDFDTGDTDIFLSSLIYTKLYKKAHEKGADFFLSQRPYFMSTLNAGKFSCRPVLKGSRQMRWYLNVS